MEKTRLKFRLVTVHHPGTGEPFLRPVITDREVYDIDRVVEFAVNSGYVRGQVEDMKGALNGFIEAVKRLSQEGKLIHLGDWVRIHGELTGAVDEQTHQLGPANSYHVLMQARKAFKCNVDAFNWTNVDEVDAPVQIDRICGDGAVGAYNLLKGRDILVTGANLAFNAASGDTATAAWKDASGADHSASLAPKEAYYALMRFAWPAAFADLAEGTEVTFSFRTHGGNPDGVLQLTRRSATLGAG